MFANLTGVHAAVILIIVLLLFGAAKLPALAKSVGQSIKILKDETSSRAELTESRVTSQENENSSIQNPQGAVRP